MGLSRIVKGMQSGPKRLPAFRQPELTAQWLPWRKVSQPEGLPARVGSRRGHQSLVGQAPCILSMETLLRHFITVFYNKAPRNDDYAFSFHPLRKCVRRKSHYKSSNAFKGLSFLKTQQLLQMCLK